MQIKPLIVLVDDESDVTELLKYNLELQNYRVMAFPSSAGVCDFLERESVDLIVLDLMLPDIDGIELCGNIRKLKLKKRPIIVFLSARSEEYTQVEAYRAGADDYITKPIRPRLFSTKIEALLNRLSLPDLESEPSAMFIDKSRYSVKIQDKTVLLPRREFEILDLLHTNRGKVYNRESILNTIWGSEVSYDINERVIDVHIRNIRNKIGDKCIRTIKGVGYIAD